MENIKKILKERLTEEKYIHSLGVQEAAIKLAQDFKEDVEKASIAGLLHDYAKNLSNEELIKTIDDNNIHIFEEEKDFFKTLHAPVGAFLVSRDLNITDEKILSAIRYHTIGDIKMNLLDKIIYVADKIETNTRDKAIIDKIVFAIYSTRNIDKGMLICYKNTIIYLVQNNLPISTHTIKMWNFLLNNKY